MKRVKEAARLLAKEGESEQVKRLLLQTLSEESSLVAIHNLAELYKEYDEYDKAFIYAKQAVAMEPKSYYPYALLGELYLRKADDYSAQQLLEKAYALYESPVVAHNLACIYKKQQEFSKAATYFIKSYETENYGLMNAVECFVLAEDLHNAKKWLTVLESEQERFIGEVEMGELYARIGHFKEAAEWYAKGYMQYSHTGEWVVDYLWVLHQLGNESQLNTVLNAFIVEINRELKELPVDAVEFEWNAGEIEEKELRLRANMERARRAHRQLEIVSNNGIYMASRCFTFFCPMHDQGLGERELDG
ncbi:tetratricopeptide repeat protein [Lysinibacillus sp. NPDC048646]|uniref:tetratricopeptide repeat protein n=1 Tax=Lysinibacillus sp. NPDC048646 TaxID=3390574 RepID=UPI003D004BF0